MCTRCGDSPATGSSVRSASAAGVPNAAVRRRRAGRAAPPPSRPLPVPRVLLSFTFSAQRKHLLWDTMGAWFNPSLLDRGTRGGVTKTA